MKYKGSKSRLMKHLNPIFNNIKEKHGLTEFLDVFTGGANVASNVNFETIIANDYDVNLIQLLKKTATDISSIEDLVTPTKEEYDIVKNNVRNYTVPEGDEWRHGAILFLGSFNARAYGGNYGCVLKKDGIIVRDYFQEAKRNLLKQKLDHIIFTNLDYKDIEYQEQQLIYMDPPYKGTTGYKGTLDHEYFWEFVRTLSKHHYVLVSELEAPIDFKAIWSKSIDHGQKQTKNKKIKIEKLFVYKNGLLK